MEKDGKIGKVKTFVKRTVVIVIYFFVLTFFFTLYGSFSDIYPWFGQFINSVFLLLILYWLYEFSLYIKKVIDEEGENNE